MLPKFDDHLVVQCVRDRSGRATGGIDVTPAQNVLHPIEPSLGLVGHGARLNDCAIELAQLLLVHQPAAGIDNLILRLVVDHGTLSVLLLLRGALSIGPVTSLPPAVWFGISLRAHL